MGNFLRIVFSFLVVLAAVVLAASFASPATSAWYSGLIKPPFMPPDAVFAPLWIILSVLLAFSLARVWNAKETPGRRMWFFAFAIQLLCNILWSVLFFTLHGVFLASIDALVLWFAVVVLTLGSYEIDQLTFWLLLPYLAWTTFSLFLNVAIWWLN